MTRSEKRRFRQNGLAHGRTRLFELYRRILARVESSDRIDRFNRNIDLTLNIVHFVNGGNKYERRFRRDCCLSGA
jgi:hypothetical protein